MFCESNYAKNKETRKSVRGLGIKLGITLLLCSSNNQRNTTLSSTDDKYVTISACIQEVKDIFY